MLDMKHGKNPSLMFISILDRAEMICWIFYSTNEFLKNMYMLLFDSSIEFYQLILFVFFLL